MKSLVLLLVMVIFVAVLYQTVFDSKIKEQSKSDNSTKIAPAMKTLKQAKELQEMLNKKNDRVDYKDRLKQH